MGKQAMLNRVVLGGVRRITGHANFQPQPMGETLETLLEHKLRGAIAAAAIAEQQQRVRPGIRRVACGGPPLTNAVAGKLAGVVADAEVDVAAVAFEVIQAVRNDVAAGERREIVIEDTDRLRSLSRK